MNNIFTQYSLPKPTLNMFKLKQRIQSLLMTLVFRYICITLPPLSKAQNWYENVSRLISRVSCTFKCSNKTIIVTIRSFWEVMHTNELDFYLTKPTLNMVRLKEGIEGLSVKFTLKCSCVKLPHLGKAKNYMQMFTD